MFSKIGSIKKFVIFTGKHLSWGLFLIKFQVYRSTNLLKIDSNTGVSCGYCKIFKNSFPIQQLRWLLLAVLPRYSKVSWVPALWFPPPRAFTFDQKLSRNVAQIILCYHVTKQFLPCLNWLVTCFQFQNMFWKNINCFRFWWKTYTKRCTSNYVISRVKRLSSPALCGWSGAFNFRVWFGKRKNAV